MRARRIAMIAFGGLLIAPLFACPKCLRAQTAPVPAKVQAPLRASLAGSWRFNRDQSDDPMQEVRSVESQSGPDSAGGGYPGGYPSGNSGGAYPGGYPGGGGGRNLGGNPGAGGYPGGGIGGGSMPRNTGQDIEDSPRMQPLIHPPQLLEVDLKTSEVDVMGDRAYELTLFTDRRQLPKKATDDTHEQVLAHWNGTQLVSDEKSPMGGKMSRTFELSQDGRKLLETVHVDNHRSPLVLHFVYDAYGADVPSGPAAKSNP